MDNNKEINNNNNNMEAKDMADTGTENFMGLIPEDEKAVSEADIIEGNKVAVVDTIEILGDVSSEIPEDEKAVETPPACLGGISKYGYFTPAVGMKGFITDTGHTFFAKVIDDSKKGRVIKYCQKYKDGTFSRAVEIEAADLIMAAVYHFMPDRIPENMLKRNVGKFILKASKDYYNSTSHLREALGIIQVLNLLIHEYETLPVENNVSLLDLPEKLYAKIIQIIKEEYLVYADDFDSYYTLCKEQIDVIAEKLHVKTIQLLKKMKEYKFLYLTGASEGYQSNIRFNLDGEFCTGSHTEWCYCILKLENLAKRRSGKE